MNRFRVINKTLIGILCIGFIIFLLSLMNIMLYNKKMPDKPRYIIILGARLYGETPAPALQNRINGGIELAKKHKDAIVICTGGQGEDEGISEGLAIKRELLKAGILENRILIEEKSTSTIENLKYSKKMLENLYLEKEEGIVVTNNYHAFRSSMVAESISLNIAVKKVNTPESFKIKGYLREIIAVVYYFVKLKM